VFDEGLNPMRVGPPGDRGAHHRSAPARGRITKLAQLTQVSGAGVDLETYRRKTVGERATRSSSARGSIASLPRKGQGLVDGSTIASSRSSGVDPLRGGDAS
jgi:hypothetical protein